MRHFLISALLLSLVAGCSSVHVGPHRIDVQQGNALDQENVARLKLGLNRSQVRFLLGTPLVVDPFRTDRWDYVYVFYKAGKLAEQKRITLFFDGDTLARIEGDLPEPVAAPATPQPEPQAAPTPAPQAAPTPEPVPSPQPEPVPAPQPEPAPATSVTPAAEPVSQPAPTVQPAPVAVQAAPAPAPVVPAPVAAESVVAQPVQPAAAAEPAPRPALPETTVVAPLPSPKGAPAYANRRPPAELSLQPEIEVAAIQPDVIPPFPEPYPAGTGDEPVLKTVDEWAAAWARRDEEAYLSAYDADFVPQGGGSRTDWEKRRRLLLGLAQNIDLKIDSPLVDRADDGTATVTFNQLYRSDRYHDAVVKQLRLAERDGRWLIVEEKVLSILRGVRP
ncbi:MAG: outer membrane protein assembly factor BamE [Gammaproteobacteria bacterium]|nr:outer membrane protein assembly factor BamE [Gammaproteobacteria bacterium]MBU1406992.1 outer membrane protein assembly factor BamE [Gammaproteobacteria bacterium]